MSDVARATQAAPTGAVFSADKLHRWALWRRWGPGPAVAFIGLNPSTADEQQDDPTVRRCIRFTKAWDYDALFMLNIFAFRSTDPMTLRVVPDPIGDENDRYLTSWSAATVMTVAAWGVHGSYLDRENAVRRLFAERGLALRYLRLTKAGHPGHPLYLPKTLVPVKW